MEYITSVNDAKLGIKHIIRVNGKNEEVIFLDKAEEYGDKRGENYYLSGRVKVYKDLTLKINNPNYSCHLAEIVSAIEKVRFVMENKYG